MLKEFKEFIMTGNVIDFAVAVILAGAIGAVINSFVGDVVMPVVGHFSGGMDFADMQHVLGSKVLEDGTTQVTAIKYGKWFNSIISLITIGFVLFMMVKAYNKATKKAEEADAGPTQEELLADIKELLKK
jgi:large conductance mechanosensitive channel